MTSRATESGSRSGLRTGPVNEILTASGPTSDALDDSVIGRVLDRSHTAAPFRIGAMVAEELTRVGARDIAIWMQDYDQRMLHPLDLPGQPDAAVEAVDGSLAGRAFGLHT